MGGYGSGTYGSGGYGGTGSQTIATLGTAVGNRLQDPTGIFWNTQWEQWAAVEEALNDLMLLVGRPTIQYATTVTLQPCTVWQPMPANMLAITNIRVGGSAWLKKTTLNALDYLQASWGPSWESDLATLPARWAPLGLTQFIVHPAPTAAITVSITGVGYPTTDAWPPNGTEESYLHDELNVALELYSQAYCMLKESNVQVVNALMAQYLDIAQRATTIEDRRDPLIFSASFGTPTTASQVSRR